MATDLVVRIERPSLHLVAATAFDQECIAALKTDPTYRARLTRATPRSVKQQRFYWAVLEAVVDNHMFYRSTQILHMYLKKRLGVFSKIEFHNGEVHIELDSTALDVMEAEPFNQYLDSVLLLIVEEILPGVERRDLIGNAELRSGVNYASLRHSEAA